MRLATPSRYATFLVLVSAASAAAACSLVIDADQLVADNATPAGDGASGEDRTTPPLADAAADGDASGFVVGCRNSPGGSIPACVPAPPAGADLLAVVWGRNGTPLACPSGYLSTPAQQGYGDLESAPPTCSPTGCTCGESGSPTCAARLQYFSDNACTVPTTSGTLEGNACERTDRANTGSAALAFSVTGVTCTAGGASSTKLTAATFCTAMQACRPDPNVTPASCPTGQVPTPPTPRARICYRASVCAAPYVAVAGFSTRATIDDTTACSCACNTNDVGCTGGTVDVWGNDNNCQASITATLAASCRPRTDYHRSARLKASGTVVAGASCKASAKLTGAVTLPPLDIALCCLPE